MRWVLNALRRAFARLVFVARRQPVLFGGFSVALAGGFALALVLFPPPWWAPPVGDDAWEQLAADDRCLAQAIYFEARGEPFEGRMAVAQVVVNRVRDQRYPNDICTVVFQNEQRRHRCQFSFACDGRSDRPRNTAAWSSALRLARLVNDGHLRDLTGQATHYHAIHVAPPWAEKLTRTVTIGRHRFYRADG